MSGTEPRRPPNACSAAAPPASWVQQAHHPAAAAQPAAQLTQRGSILPSARPQGSRTAGAPTAAALLCSHTPAHPRRCSRLLHQPPRRAWGLARQDGGPAQGGRGDLRRAGRGARARLPRPRPRPPLLRRRRRPGEATRPCLRAGAPFCCCCRRGCCCWRRQCRCCDTAIAPEGSWCNTRHSHPSLPPLCVRRAAAAAGAGASSSSRRRPRRSEPSCLAADPSALRRASWAGWAGNGALNRWPQFSCTPPARHPRRGSGSKRAVPRMRLLLGGRRPAEPSSQGHLPPADARSRGCSPNRLVPAAGAPKELELLYRCLVPAVAGAGGRRRAAGPSTPGATSRPPAPAPHTSARVRRVRRCRV